MEGAPLPQDKTVALTERNTELDAKAHEAEAAGNRAALARVRLEQEKEILERHNEWLNAELARKTEAYQQERTGATAQARLARRAVPGKQCQACQSGAPGARLGGAVRASPAAACMAGAAEAGWH